MKKLIFPALLTLIFQSQLSFANVDSDCRDLKEAVEEIGQRVESLRSQFKLARLNGDDNLQNLKMQLGEALTLQIEFEQDLAQCKEGKKGMLDISSTGSAKAE